LFALLTARTNSDRLNTIKEKENKMQNVIDLQNNLENFHGTIAYHGLSKKLVLTDGALYLAENAECFWLFDIVNSVLFDAISKIETFLNVEVKRDDSGFGAEVSIDDGNGTVLYTQKIEYTDFPFNEFSFFVQQTRDGMDQPFYVAMLKGEY
jgi:hypothetical protein